MTSAQRVKDARFSWSRDEECAIPTRLVNGTFKILSQGYDAKCAAGLSSVVSFVMLLHPLQINARRRLGPPNKITK